MLDIANYRPLLHQAQDHSKAFTQRILLLHPESPRSHHLLHLIIHSPLMDILRRRLNLTLDLSRVLHIVQRLLLVLRAVHLLRYDQLPRSCNWKRKV